MHHSPSTSIRYLIIFSILIFSSAILFSLSQKLVGQLYIRKAEQEAVNLRFTSAAKQLQKALVLLPYDSLTNNSLGNIFYKMGSTATEPSEKLILFKKSRHHFDRALELNSLDARSAYGLARAEIRIEQHNYQSEIKERKMIKATALPALEKAIALRPASTIYHLALARYLFLHNDNERLLSEVRVLGQLQPTMLNQLRRQAFWSDVARNAFQLGVNEALAAGTTPRQSLFALSEIMAEEQTWQAAISYKKEGMAIQAALNQAGDYISLGYLYLMLGERDRAFENFFLALQYSRNIEKDIIYAIHVCSKAGDPEALLDFYYEAGKRFGSSFQMELSAAKNLIKLQDLENAKTVLQKANARQPNSEAYYLLMRIAEKEQDWDEAELAIQKAAMYDPQNSNYHLAFSRVLNRLQKYERAEKEAGLAIQHVDNLSAGLFHYRASLRMKIDDYKGALEDWQKAVELDPDNRTYVNQLERLKGQRLKAKGFKN